MSVLWTFWRDQRGSMSVEFLLWVPFLAFWMTASVAFYDAWMSRNQAAKVTHTVADILSRQEVVNAQFLFQIDALQSSLLNRASGDGRLRVSSVQRSVDEVLVLWSCTNHRALPPLQPDTIPDGLLPRLADGDSVIVTELSVPWSRFAGIAFLVPQDWYFRVSTLPRFTPMLELNGECP